MIKQRKEQYNLACEEVRAAADAIDAAAEDISSEDLGQLSVNLASAKSEAERCSANLEDAEMRQNTPKRFNAVGGREKGNAVELRADQQLREFVKPKSSTFGEKLSLGKYLRGMALGQWENAEAEKRALALGALSSGGAMVPEFLAAELIDMARAQSVALKAGVSTVLLETAQNHYARMTGEPSGEWHAEGASLTDEELTFDQVTFKSRTATILCRASLELVQDAINLEQVLASTFAKILALKMDYATLIGGTDASGVTPVGIRNQDGVPFDTLDSVMQNYDWLTDGIGSIRAQNFEPNALITSPQVLTEMAKLKDQNNNPLTVPTDVAALAKYSTTQIPATNESFALLGQFNQGLLGVRTDVRFEVFRETLIENLEFAFLAYVRCDFQVAQPNAFLLIDPVTLVESS